MTNSMWGYVPLDAEDIDAREEENQPADVPGVWLVVWFVVGILMWMGLWRVWTWLV